MSDYTSVALILMKSPEGEATVDLLSERPGVQIIDHGTYWKIVADHEIRVRMEDVAERLARPLDIAHWLVIMTSYVGRALATDDEFVVSSEMRYLENGHPAPAAAAATSA